ncbi:glycosyltransferase family 2 protein [Streptomyces sp. NPDC059010]|uniref:glycosyltransferase family 2 protein n=1 Tax=Streptomyces sp. NPDC059010 TaxID=3346695 RepID=UPI003691B8AB
MAGTSPVHVVSVVGSQDAPLLPHFVEHYRSVGLNSFRLICHAETPSDEGYIHLRDACRTVGVEPLHSHFGPWRDRLNQKLKAYAMSRRPDDWYVVADVDEFHVYSHPVHELLEKCERSGADHVNGCFLDRVGAGGELLEVDATPLWKRYPLAGAVSAGISKALPLKTGVVRGRVELLVGHHGTVGGRGLPRAEGFIQVHHFKWTESVVRRMRHRVDSLSRGRWPVEHYALIREAKAALAHLDGNGGWIDVDDPRLRTAPCGRDYTDHSLWDEIADEAEGWAWTLTY